MRARVPRRGGLARLALAAALLATGGRAAALVTATDPDDGSAFLGLYRPTGAFDETSLSGFEFLISSRVGEFRAFDQYLVSGEETAEGSALGSDLGGVGELSGVPFSFAIEHRLAGGRHFLFRVTDPRSQRSHALCWGDGCPPEAVAAAQLGRISPIWDYNGLQVQVRAQDVPGASAELTLTGLSGVDVAGAPLFDEVVTPSSPGTVAPIDAGRRGQWLLADDLDLVEREWQLRGVVTLTRPDAALEDVTKVRLAVDLVRDPELPFLDVPEPRGWLQLAVGGCVLLPLARLARRRASLPLV